MRVHVDEGVGAYQGGQEITWVTHFDGNGEAERFIAETGSKYGQDSVLMINAGEETILGAGIGN